MCVCVCVRVCVCVCVCVCVYRQRVRCFDYYATAPQTTVLWECSGWNESGTIVPLSRSVITDRSVSHGTD